MKSRVLPLAILLAIASALPVSADEEGEPVFSGPQPGEKLPGLKVRLISGEKAGQDVDIVAEAGSRPTVIVFMHELTRPGFALSNAVMRYASERQKDISAAYVFLGADATATEARYKRIGEQLWAPKIPRGLSMDGIEGPGSYGLNRNVSLTVVIAKNRKVSANFALVQPSLQADGPKILKAITDVAGGEVPDLAKLAPRMMRANARNTDGIVRRLFGQLIQKDATAEDFKAAKKQVEAAMKRSPAIAKDISTRARRIVDSGKLANYGTPQAQAYIKELAADASDAEPAAKDSDEKPQRKERPERGREEQSQQDPV